MRNKNENSLEYLRQRILSYSNLDVKNTSSKRDYVYARVVFVKIMRDEFIDCTFENIAEFLGKKHCTLIYAYNQFTTIEKYESKYYQMYKFLLIELEQEHLIIKNKVFGHLEEEKEIAYAREVVTSLMTIVQEEVKKYKKKIKEYKYEAVTD